MPSINQSIESRFQPLVNRTVKFVPSFFDKDDRVFAPASLATLLELFSESPIPTRTTLHFSPQTDRLLPVLPSNRDLNADFVFITEDRGRPFSALFAGLFFPFHNGKTSTSPVSSLSLTFQSMILVVTGSAYKPSLSLTELRR